MPNLLMPWVLQSQPTKTQSSDKSKEFDPSPSRHNHRREREGGRQWGVLNHVMQNYVPVVCAARSLEGSSQNGTCLCQQLFALLELFKASGLGHELF